MAANLLYFIYVARGFQYKSDLLAEASSSDIPHHTTDITSDPSSPNGHSAYHQADDGRDDDRSRLRAGGYGASDDE
jgi:hypothetical protein